MILSSRDVKPSILSMKPAWLVLLISDLGDTWQGRRDVLGDVPSRLTGQSLRCSFHLVQNIVTFYPVITSKRRYSRDNLEVPLIFSLKHKIEKKSQKLEQVWDYGFHGRDIPWCVQYFLAGPLDLKPVPWKISVCGKMTTGMLEVTKGTTVDTRFWSHSQDRDPKATCPNSYWFSVTSSLPFSLSLWKAESSRNEPSKFSHRQPGCLRIWVSWYLAQ